MAAEDTRPKPGANVVALPVPAGTASKLLEVRDVDAVFAPLDPVPYLLKHWDMCPGAPVLFAGYGFSGKTVAAQSLALAVAGNKRAFGDFEVQRHGRVVHVDFEQAFRLTAERYQRLARPMKLDAEDLRGRLAVSSLANVHLSAQHAPDAFRRAAEGAELLIVDSLRASAPDVDENSSEVRRLLDTLTAVSDVTKATVLVIHHARKPSADDTAARFAVRGSSAIFDACASVLVFSAAKGDPVTITHEKARTSGVCAEDTHLKIDDVRGDDDERWGLCVSALPREAIAQKERAKADAKNDEVDAKVLAFVAENPGSSVRVIRAGVTVGRNCDRDTALERLLQHGKVREESGPRGARLFFPVGGAA
jgi:hypothetical protein